MLPTIINMKQIGHDMFALLIYQVHTTLTSKYQRTVMYAHAKLHSVSKQAFEYMSSMTESSYFTFPQLPLLLHEALPAVPRDI